MLTEFAQWIGQMARPVALEGPRGPMVYNDSEKQYKLFIPEFNRKVSCIDSFAKAVTEECRRRENLTGNFMTAILDDRGGIFHPDDKSRLDKWTYERTFSTQWLLLERNLNKPLKHQEFLRLLQGLRPSLGSSETYAQLYREFRKVSFDNKTKVVSQPILENGSTGLDISLTLETLNGQTQTSMPGELQLEMPWVKAGNIVYRFTIQIDPMVVDGMPVFYLVFPEHEAIVEKALLDEQEAFKGLVSEHKDLLILLDY